MIALTASKVELARRCPAAFALPHAVEVHEGQEEGEDRHEDLEDAINKGDIPSELTERWPDHIWRSEVAYAINVATSEGRELGVGIGRNYPDLGPNWVYATVDLEGIGPDDEILIGDRKSFDPNVPRARFNPQLHTGALAAAQARGKDSATVFIWHEARPIDVHAMDGFDLATFCAELASIYTATTTANERLRAGLIAPTPGTQCRWCPAFHSCPAQTALAQRVANDEVSNEIEMVMPFRDDEQAADAYELLARIGMLHKRLKSALIARATEKPFRTRGGMMYGSFTTEGNDKLSGDVTYDVVREFHGQNVADACVERVATKKRIKDALQVIAGKGQLAGMEKKVIAEIAKRGGISNKTSTKVGEYPPALAAGASK